MGEESLLDRPKMESRIHRVREQAEVIWKKPLLRQYTDHTVEHSKRVIAILDKLCALVEPPLADDEAYVLLCAAYLHDIGMQQEKFYEMAVIKERYSPDEIATAEDDEKERDAIIRRWHHLISEERIKCELGTEYIEEEFIDEVAAVCKGHTKENLEKYEDVTKAGSPMRLQMLAALLRLADELDLDYRRVDLHELEQAEVPDESKAHWWQCHYVESVDVEADGSVRVSFRFPAKDGEDAANVVPRLVLDRLSRKLDQDKLIDVLLPNVRIKLNNTPRILSPGTSKQPAPEAVKSILKEELLNLSVQRASESLAPVIPFASGTVSISIGETPEKILRDVADLWQSGHEDEALATLERGASRFPMSAPIQSQLADAYNQYNRLGEAERAAQRALDSNPGHFLGQFTMGVALTLQGRSEQALGHLQLAELISGALTLPYLDRQRLHFAIAQSLAGVNDYWHALQRVKRMSQLASASGDETVSGIESEILPLQIAIEESLNALETQEGNWVFTDLAVNAVLGQWATEPPCVYAGPTVTGDGIALGGSSLWLDYVFECQFQLLKQAAGFFIRADARAMTGLMMQLTPVMLRHHQKEFSDYHRHEIIEVDLPVALDRTEWHTVRFEVAGSTLKTYVNDQLVDEWLDVPAEHASGKVGFRVFLGEVALYQLPKVTVTRMAVPKA